MSKLFFTLLCSLFLLPLAHAQQEQYLSASDSDPEAVRLLDQLRKKYDAYETMSADFRLDIDFPGQQVDTQKGHISRRGDQVRFQLGKQEGIINDQAAYLIQHTTREVMINNLPEPGEMNGVLTPQTLFSFYEGDAFVLALVGEESVQGRSAKVIELKPVDRNESEFTKMRLLVDANRQEIINIKAFSRDGSSYTFHLDSTKADPALPAGTFVFSKDEFPDYHVEDLRY